MHKSSVLYTFAIPVILLGLAFTFPGCKEPEPETVELEFWGIFDDSDVYNPLIEDFNEEFPHIKINYRKKNNVNYEDEILEAMATGRGPDIFMIFHTWLPKYENKISAAPAELISLKELRDNFMDVVNDDFVKDGQIAALPLSIDTLAVYYNKDFFNTAGIAQFPETWEEFSEDVQKLTIKDKQNNIIRAGAAIGTAKNINRSTDILSLLMLQSGTQMVDGKKTKATFQQNVQSAEGLFSPGQQALLFYTNFANPLKSVYTWNQNMHYSIDAFYEGKVAMIFNYAYNFPIIQAKSPYLNFAIAPMPQIKDSSKDVNYANYWGLTVSKNSQDSQAAWQFITWLAKTENAKKYLEATQKPTARRDLVSWQKNDPDLGVFVNQSLTAHSWYQVDSFSIEKYLAEMIELVVTGQATAEEAITSAANKITVLMR